MTKKILWFDTETTGTSPAIHSMLSIGGIIDIDGKIADTFEFKTKPHPDFEIDPDAFKFNKFDPEEINNFPEMKDTRKDLINIFSKYIDRYNSTDKFIVAGQNIQFDIDILSHFFYRQKDFYLRSYLNFRKRIELHDITKSMKMLGFIESDSLSLGPLCHELGIKIDAHNALSDITATRDIYYEIVNNLVWKREGN